MNMSSANPKRALYAQFASVAKALGHAHRLELLELIAQGERTVETLADRCGITIANTSQHLQHLRRAGLVSARRDGKFVLYALTDDAVLAAISAVHRVAERNIAEVNRILRTYFLQRDELEPVSRAELQERLKKGLVTLLDVRPEDEFRLGHLPGAVNVPLAKLRSWLSGAGKKLEIVAYCRGSYCVMSFEAVAELRAKGFKARRLDDGFPEWKAAGLPVQTGLTAHYGRQRAKA
jgi:rhodanese-related sulfurtransferase/DNA-binding HxlR family transcriptional regulator